MAGKKISAVDIKRLWHAPADAVTADLTGAALATLLSASTTKEVEICQKLSILNGKFFLCFRCSQLYFSLINIDMK